jgi:hypothetical protein
MVFLVRGLGEDLILASALLLEGGGCWAVVAVLKPAWLFLFASSS